MQHSLEKIIRELKDLLKFPEMQDICTPLALLDICSFFYIRRYSDFSFVDLSTDPDSSENFFKKFYQLEYSTNDIQEYVFTDRHLSLSELSPQNNVWKDNRELYKIGNGVLLMESSLEYNEIYCFYSRHDNYLINQFYLNNLHVLQQFIRYFEEKSRPLIKDLINKKLIIPEEYRQKSEINVSCFTNTLWLPEKFLESICNNTINLGKAFSYNNISIKEAECLYWILHGKTTEEISIILHKSYKTVEKQIDSLKNKFSCHKLNQLISMAIKSGIADIVKCIIMP